MIQQKWLHLQTKIAHDDYLKIAVRCGTHESFDNEWSNSIRSFYYAWNMILGDNPAGHGFVLRDLVLIELFQISHNCVTECTLQAKF